MSDVVITGGTSIIAEFPPIENVVADTVYIQGPPGVDGGTGTVRVEMVSDFADITSPEPGVLYLRIEP